MQWPLRPSTPASGVGVWQWLLRAALQAESPPRENRAALPASAERHAQNIALRASIHEPLRSVIAVPLEVAWQNWSCTVPAVAPFFT